jgi:uncharacterized metal-binding protein YceD (DUF177 family)
VKRTFKIPFVQLSSGSHNYDFLVDEEFFREREGGLIEKGNVHVLLDFKKAENLFELNFNWDGYLVVNCDNCLDEIKYPVKGSNTIEVKVQSQPAEDEPDLIYITPQEQELWVDQLIYDFLMLDLPMRKLCENSLKEPKQCNESITSFLKSSETDNTGQDGTWDKLKVLFNKDKNGSSET